MNIGTTASDYFQSDEQLQKLKLIGLKRSNTLGKPIQLPAKILHCQTFQSPYLIDSSSVCYLLIADSGFTAGIVNTEVLSYLLCILVIDLCVTFLGQKV
jgi:hypothetical protein